MGHRVNDALVRQSYRQCNASVKLRLNSKDDVKTNVGEQPLAQKKTAAFKLTRQNLYQSLAKSPVGFMLGYGRQYSMSCLV